MLDTDILYKIIDINKKIYLKLPLVNKFLYKEIWPYRFIYLKKKKRENEAWFEGFFMKKTKNCDLKHNPEFIKELIINRVIPVNYCDDILIKGCIESECPGILKFLFKMEKIDVLEKKKFHKRSQSQFRAPCILELIAERGKTKKVFKLILDNINDKELNTKRGKKIIDNVMKILIKSLNTDFFEILIKKINPKMIIDLQDIRDRLIQNFTSNNKDIMVKFIDIIFKYGTFENLKNHNIFIKFLVQEYDIEIWTDYYQNILKKYPDKKKNILLNELLINCYDCNTATYNLGNIDTIFKIIKTLNLNIEDIISFKNFFNLFSPEKEKLSKLLKLLNYFLNNKYYHHDHLVREKDIIYLIDGRFVNYIKLILKYKGEKMLSNWNYLKRAINNENIEIFSSLFDSKLIDINRVTNEVIGKRKTDLYMVLLKDKRINESMHHGKLIKYFIKTSHSDNLDTLISLLSKNDRLEVSYKENMLLFTIIKKMYLSQHNDTCNCESTKLRSLENTAKKIIKHKKFNLCKIQEILELCIKYNYSVIVAMIINEHMGKIKINENCIDYLFRRCLMEDAIKIFEEILKNGKLNSIEIDYLLKKYLPKYLAYSFKLFWHGGYDKLWNDYRIRNFIIKNNNYIITEIYNLSYFLTDSMFSSFIMKLTEKEVIKLSHNFFKKLIIEDFKEEWLLYTNLDEKSRLEIALKFDKFQYMKDILDKKIEFK